MLAIGGAHSSELPMVLGISRSTIWRREAADEPACKAPPSERQENRNAVSEPPAAAESSLLSLLEAASIMADLKSKSKAEGPPATKGGKRCAGDEINQDGIQKKARLPCSVPHAKRSKKSTAAQPKAPAAPAPARKQKKAKAAKGKKAGSASPAYDKEYYKTRKSKFAHVFGRGDSWVATVKTKNGGSKQLYFADENDAAAAVDTFSRERGEKGPNFNDDPRYRMTIAQVEAKRMRHGERFQSKSKDQINYSFKPSSQYKGVSLLHVTFVETKGVWTARIIQSGKRISLGSFRSEEEAARAWDRKAREEGRTFLNFPDEA